MHHGFHHLLFVLLSLFIAVLGSWTALDLFRRVEANVGRIRSFWLAAAALAMGAGIWTMHFVAMLGFDFGSAVSYEPWLTITSFILAVAATGVAFYFVAPEDASRIRIVAAGFVMGIGICAMHYVGMAAVRSSVSLGYDLRFVSLSLAVAIGAASMALLAARKERSTLVRSTASLILGLAVAGMHYTAMAALKLTPISDAVPHVTSAPPYALAFAVAAVTMFVLCLALVASSHDHRADILIALDAGGVGYWELDLQSRALYLSPKGKKIFGLPRDEPLTHAQALDRVSPHSRNARERHFSEVLETGKDYDIEYALVSDGRWVNARGRVLRSHTGRSSRMVGVVMDVTERRNAVAEVISSEKRQRILVDELNHRVMNTLATIQSIASDAARRTDGARDFLRDFEARLAALSSTHKVLTRNGWERACLRELVQAELHSYPSDQVSFVGEGVDLNVRQALTLGMVLHELAINSVKHGALSTRCGWVGLSWAVRDVGDDATLAINWIESASLSGAETPRAGFGTRLLRKSVEGELGGKVDIDYSLEGLRCYLTIPLDRTGDPPCIERVEAGMSYPHGGADQS